MWYGVWYELCAFLGFRIVVDYVKNSCWLHNLRARRNWNSSLMNFNHFNKSAKKSLKFSMSPTMSPIWSPKWMLPVPPQQSKVNHWVLYWESSVNWPSFLWKPSTFTEWTFVLSIRESRTVLWKTKRNYPSLILTDKKYFHQNISKYI